MTRDDLSALIHGLSIQPAPNQVPDVVLHDLMEGEDFSSLNTVLMRLQAVKNLKSGSTSTGNKQK